MGLRFSFPIELRIDLTSLPQGWKEEVVPFLQQVPTSSLDPGFYSRLFLVPKKMGGMRPVIDLSILNTYLVVPHFKMETNRYFLKAAEIGQWK
jgi:hypothetical protein